VSTTGIRVEPVRLLGGEIGHDFVLYDIHGGERFFARLLIGSDTLQIRWTDHLPRTLLRLREVKQIVEFSRIVHIAGVASGSFETQSTVVSLT
jgi:hypothetical protein